MKRTILMLMAATLVLICGCNAAKDAAPQTVIFETDLGNDVDDAMALDLFFKYMDEGKIDLAAIMLNKEGDFSAEYADILCTWYGHPEVQIGIIKDGADCAHDAVQYAQAVCEMQDADGNPLFARTRSSFSDLPLAVDLYRKILSEAPDQSVVIVSTGFSTNLARLLDTPADDVSPLTGRELVARKVSLLSTMAGVAGNENAPEYNIMKDIPAAKKVFAEWPGKIVDSPFEVGISIRYPGTSIEQDFAWAAAHPMVEAYKVYNAMPYDEPTWDVTSFLYTVEGQEKDGKPLFGMVGPGLIEVNDGGGMRFTPDASGNRFYLTADSTQCANVLALFLEKLPAVPAAQKRKKIEKKIWSKGKSLYLCNPVRRCEWDFFGSSLKRLKEVQASTEKNCNESVDFFTGNVVGIRLGIYLSVYTKKSLILAQDER